MHPTSNLNLNKRYPRPVTTMGGFMGRSQRCCSLIPIPSVTFRPHGEISIVDFSISGVHFGISWFFSDTSCTGFSAYKYSKQFIFSFIIVIQWGSRTIVDDMATDHESHGSSTKSCGSKSICISFDSSGVSAFQATYVSQVECTWSRWQHVATSVASVPLT